MENSKKFNIAAMVQCSLFAALLCVLAPLAVPVGVVPVSLGLFAVMLCAVVLGAYKGIISLGVYLLMGVLGLPVFAGGQTGLSTLAGPTGGYVWSYILVCLIIGLVSRQTYKKKFVFVSCLAAILVCYLCGTMQFMAVTGSELSNALVVCVYPFVAFDIIKAVCAVVLGANIRKRLANAGFLI
ncbi:MAG: biotin transporter BioY [Clostridia bacterium]|nr:biotin transporter BioY [Clostridia bacterium]